MNGAKLFLDTNIALYFLGGDTVLATLLDNREISLSVISEMEMLGYPGISEADIQKIKAFIADCQVYDLNAPIKERAIELRRTYNLKLPDAIIASTALELNLPLVSADGIFGRVTELNFVHYSF